MCQKAVGGPFIALATFRPNKGVCTLATRGQFPSSTVSTRRFCADCGTPLAYVDDDSGNVELTLGSLDHPGKVAPTRVTGEVSHIGWVDSVPSLPTLTTQQNDAGRNKRPVVSFQHPDHDTSAD